MEVIHGIRTYTIILWILLTGFKSWAQSQPQVTCLQVDDLGNVTVNWIPPAAPSFSHYEIVFSISPSLSFTSIADNLTPVSLSSHIHSTNLALSNSYYYAVLAWYNDGAGGSYSISSDTLSTIYLEAEAAQNMCANCDSAAHLQWNEPQLPAGTDTNNLQYQIWTDYPGNTWQLLTTVNYGINEYIQYVTNCDPIAMNFQIRLVTAAGCEFVSNISGDEFADAVFPHTGSIIKMEVNANGDAFLTWEHLTTDDIVGYNIYRCQGGATLPIGEVNSEPWQFTDFFAPPDQVNVYKVAARDNCGNLDTSNCRSSSLLEVIPHDVCNQKISVHWTAFGGWSDLPDYYIVYRGFDVNNDYSAVVLNPIDTVLATDYDDYDFQVGGHCIYRVEAVDTIAGYRSFSNFADTYVDDYLPPEYFEIQSATVLNHDSVQITVGMTPTESSFRYELQRLDAVTQTWEEVLVVDTSAAIELIFIDERRATDAFSYSYRVVIYDGCGRARDTSNVASTMLLEGQANQERLVNTLRWSPYAEWADGVKRYEIYRKLKGQDFELIDEINGGAGLFYEDDVSELVETDGDFVYRVDAIEKSDESPFFSRSNEVNLSIDPIIWIPNSIVIGGYNDVFKPTMSFAFVEEYYLVIFSRWGDLLFETRNIEEGWDGMLNNRYVQEGVYNYYMTVKDGRGRAIDQFGFLTVLNYE